MNHVCLEAIRMLVASYVVSALSLYSVNLITFLMNHNSRNYSMEFIASQKQALSHIKFHFVSADKKPYKLLIASDDIDSAQRTSM